jgi:class 3 adenylate cyclase/tetratricopeptide (TPR) repeat protein
VRSDIEGDVRTTIVTLLFTDIVASTELGVRVGDDAADELRRTHFGDLREAIDAHHGEEVKHLGDGVMASFAGAADAFACAAAIQRATVDNEDVFVRVGIHAGEVRAEEGDYFGTPVVIAQRLCAVAKGGQVLVSDIVRDLAGSRTGASCRSVGPLQLRSIDEPVAASELVWSADTEPALPDEPVAPPRPPIPPSLRATPRTSFAGRMGDLARLEQHWRGRGAGPQLVLVAGEPGIGKTRLVREFALRQHDEGAVVLFGRCDEEELVPYQPFVEAVGHAVEHLPVSTLRKITMSWGGDLAKLVPQIVHRGVAALAPHADPEGERYRLFQGVAAFISGLAATHGAILVMDDLHWAGQPTLALLQHLIRTSQSQPLLVVGTYRDTEVGANHPLTALVADLRREIEVGEITLTGLTIDEIGEIGRGVTGNDLDVTMVHSRSAGNPLYAQELLRLSTDPGDALEVPAKIQQLIGRRLEKLSDDARRALRVAAVIGARFRISILAEVLGFDEEPLLDSLDEGLAAGLVDEARDDPEVCVFSHDLVRQALYAELSKARRTRAHLRIAEALEKRSDTAPVSVASELAYHYFHAAAVGDHRKAVAYALIAGDEALDVLAAEDAVRQFRRGLEVLERDADADPRSRWELLVRLGESLQIAANEAGRAAFLAAPPGMADAIEVLLSAVDVARGLGAVEFAEAVTSVVEWSPYVTMGALDDDRAVALIDEALAVLDAEHGGLRAKLLASLASRAKDNGPRLALAREAVALARQFDDTAALAWGLATLLYVLAIDGPQNGPERRDISNEMIALPTEVGDLIDREVIARLSLVEAGLETGDREATDTAVEDLTAFADRFGNKYCAAYADLDRAGLALGDGRIADAERLIESSLASSNNFSVYFIRLLLIRREQGRLAELEPQLIELRATGFGRVALALLYLETEPVRTEEARALFADLSLVDDAFLGYAQQAILAFAGEVCRYLDDLEHAPRIYDALLPSAGYGLSCAGVSLGAADRYLAIVVSIMGRHDEAEERFQAAHKFTARFGAALWAARTRIDHAEALAARGEKERAKEMLDATASQVRALGLPSLAARLGGNERR